MSRAKKPATFGGIPAKPKPMTSLTLRQARTLAKALDRANALLGAMEWRESPTSKRKTRRRPMWRKFKALIRPGRKAR